MCACVVYGELAAGVKINSNAKVMEFNIIK